MHLGRTPFNMLGHLFNPPDKNGHCSLVGIGTLGFEVGKLLFSAQKHEAYDKEEWNLSGFEFLSVEEASGHHFGVISLLKGDLFKKIVQKQVDSTTFEQVTVGGAVSQFVDILVGGDASSGKVSVQNCFLYSHVLVHLDC